MRVLYRAIFALTQDLDLYCLFWKTAPYNKCRGSNLTDYTSATRLNIVDFSFNFPLNQSDWPSFTFVKFEPASHAGKGIEFLSFAKIRSMLGTAKTLVVLWMIILKFKFNIKRLFHLFPLIKYFVTEHSIAFHRVGIVHQIFDFVSRFVYPACTEGPIFPI